MDTVNKVRLVGIVVFGFVAYFQLYIGYLINCAPADPPDEPADTPDETKGGKPHE